MQAGVDLLDERRAGREREQLGQVAPHRVADRDRAVAALDADVDVQPEGVVAPDHVLQQLVVPPVVRRVDDPLLLPARPRVRADRAEQHALVARERVQLRAALGHLRGRLAELGALAGAHLDLGRDQLADEVRLEVGAARRRLEILEAVDQLERPGVEDRELLLDREREVGSVLERVARERELLVGRELLFLAHAGRRLPPSREPSSW